MTKARVAPTPETMDRAEANWGTDAYHAMADGWNLHSETFMPSGPANAVMILCHGWNESTQTLGTRRLAHACKQRGIVLFAYDQHAHGLSLKKGDVSLPESARGQTEGGATIARHLVELAKIVTTLYKLPLVVVSHSLSTTGAIMAHHGMEKACKEAGGKLACHVILGAVPSGLSPAWCCDCFWKVCCAKVICACCTMATREPGLVNPGMVLGEPDRNASKMKMSNIVLNMCVSPPHYETGELPRSATARLDADVAALNGSAPARIFAGTSDYDTMSKARIAQYQAKLQAPASIAPLDDAVHDVLSSDPKALQHIDVIMAYVVEQLAC